MATIDASMVRAKFSLDVIANYSAQVKPKNFLAGYFKRVTKPTDYLAWNVRRYTQTIAKDVVRGADPIRVEFTKSVQKVEQPPYFWREMDLTQLEGYNRTWNAALLSSSYYNDFMGIAMQNMDEIRSQIDRNYEWQAACFMRDGIVRTYANGNTNFNRRPESMIGYTGAINWADNTVNPKDIIEQLATFVMTIGQNESGELDLIMGAKAYKAFTNNLLIQNESQKLWSVLTSLEKPAARGDGSKFVGQISAGPYTLNVITYPAFYNADPTDPASFTPFIDDNWIGVMPTNPYWIHGFAMVPKLPDMFTGGNIGASIGAIGGTDGLGQYFVSEFVDERRTAWLMGLKSAGMCIPVAVDQIASAYVLAP